MTTVDDRALDSILAGDSLGARFAGEMRRHGTRSYDLKASATHHGILESRATVDTSIGWATTESPDVPTSALPVRVGDLFTRLPTAANAVAYVVEVNVASLETGASATPEAGAKAEIEADWAGGILPLKKFSAWVGATEEIMEDVPFLQDYVDRTLVARYLAVREESQLMDGDGTGDNLLGIRHVTGIQTQAFSSSVAQTIAKAVGLVEDADGVVDGIAIHPDAYRLSQFTAPAFWTELRQDGIRVVKTRRVGVNKAIVGSFSSGGLIRERETTVRFADEHSNWFLLNKVAFLAERREVLITRVPLWFVDTALA